MNYLTNDRNLARAGALSATNIVPSGVVYRIDEDEKAGGGTVNLTGAFAGDVDRVFELEVVSDDGAARSVTAPRPFGTGNGSMTAVSADLSVAAQEVTVELRELGTATAKAETQFEGVRIVASASGAVGNAIRVSIDTSEVVAALSPAYRYSLPAPLQAGVSEYRGVGWNFATPYLTDAGHIPAESPRLRFGDDPQVYRPFRRRVGGVDVFGFSPAPVRDIAAGAPVKLVTGGYVLGVTDGVTTEVIDTFAGEPIVTLYHALSALDMSALVDVVGPVGLDLTPGGQGVTELSVRTRPYVVSVERDGTSYVRDAELGLTVSADGPTETLRLECIDVSDAGAEVWSVKANVSGPLRNAVTDVLYNDGPYAFRIPLPAASSAGVVGQITARYVRPDGSGILPNFDYSAVLGIAARNGSFTFEWRPRPQFCAEIGETIGGPNPECLGLIPEGEDPMNGPSKYRRLQRLTAAVRAFVRENTLVPPLGQETTTNDAEPPQTSVTRSSVADQDILFVRTSADILKSALTRLSGDDIEDIPTRAASTPYAVDAIVVAAVAGVAYRFAANNTGTTDSGDPTWNATLGAAVTDGGVTWENVGLAPLGMWDALFNDWKSDIASLEGTTFNVPINGWEATSDLETGHEIRVGGGNGATARVTAPGTTGSTAPAFPTAIGDTVVDGEVTWTIVARDSFRTELNRRAIPDAYHERYRSAVRDILAAAGIDADFDVTSPGNGDGCWSDIEEADYYWACITPDADYAPIFTNVYYHASTLQQIEGGGEAYRSTKEFGFGMKLGCPELIRPGDQITITIRNVNGVSTYQQGDEIVVSVVRAEPVALTGGVDGDDTLTWFVRGSVLGPMATYELDLNAPAAYADQGIGFTITPGAIPFAVHDKFTFAVEAARGQWRVDGGAWSSTFEIDGTPVELSDGLSAVFVEGPAPSWVPGDRWAWRAVATNGVDQLRKPTDARCAWTDSTLIEIEGGAIDGVLLGDHTIPADATITLTGSDDGFVTIPLSVVIPWRHGSIWQAIGAARAEYRLTIDRTGTMNWLWLGEPPQLEIQNGAAELGALTMRYRLPGASRRRGIGATVAHDGVAQASFDAWRASIESACREDDRRIGIVPVDTHSEAGIVTVDADSLEVRDVFQFQPADVSKRLLEFNIDLAPIA